MISGPGNSLYNLSSYIQSNATLNRATMETFGVEIPYIIMANNKDERVERSFRACFFIIASFLAPLVSMPTLNKMFLKKEGLLEHPEEKHILQISKEYLAKNEKFMLEGIEKTKEELKNTKKEKFKNVSLHFENILKRFPEDKSKEILRQKLIKVHKNVFLADFLIASMCAISVPWVANYLTEKRTKRIGYVGEFKIADSNYTDKMAEKHKKLKKTKIGISVAIPVLVASGLSNMIKKSMLHPEEKLGKIGRYLKRNINMFDYKNAIYMSKMGYLAVMYAGDLPAYMLACRDKHELKMRTTAWAFILVALFGGDFALNNMVGRACDKHLGTQLINRDNVKKSGFFRDFLLDINSFEKLNKMAKVSPQTKKAALAMYWGNLALTTILMGFGVSAITNSNMKKDVKKDLVKLKEKSNLYAFQIKNSKSLVEWQNNINNKKFHLN